jgi:hypothetical protein
MSVLGTIGAPYFWKPMMNGRAIISETLVFVYSLFLHEFSGLIFGSLNCSFFQFLNPF